MDKPTVVKVSKTEFELSDGQIFPHFAELEEIPTVEEFQALYDHWRSVLSNESNVYREAARHRRNSRKAGSVN